jgi:hypothetical protein
MGSQRPKARGLALIGVFRSLAGGEGRCNDLRYDIRHGREYRTGCSGWQGLLSCELMSTPAACLYLAFVPKQRSSLKSRMTCEASTLRFLSVILGDVDS